jgi:hypothetical protein
MAIPANHRFLHLNGQMETLYASALEAWPMLLDRLLAHLETGAPLGEEFDGHFC